MATATAPDIDLDITGLTGAQIRVLIKILRARDLVLSDLCVRKWANEGHLSRDYIVVNNIRAEIRALEFWQYLVDYDNGNDPRREQWKSLAEQYRADAREEEKELIAVFDLYESGKWVPEYYKKHFSQ
jgi:hypothetical protein